MKNKQAAFERQIYPSIRKDFREILSENETEEITVFFEKLIKKGNYAETVNKIKSLREFSENSYFINQMKLDWWEGFLKDNMHRTAHGKIQLIDMEGNIREFDTTKEVYEKFIAEKNETIWEPYHNVFTKIFTEWWVEAIVKACRKISLQQRLTFINSAIIEIEKEQALERYTKYELNEHLQYYKSILQLSLKDSSTPKSIHQNAKVFSALTADSRVSQLKEYLYLADFDSFFNCMKTIYGSIPYQLFKKEEAFFHSVFHVVLFLISSGTNSEVQTNKGRIDSMIEIDNAVFLFEFKLTTAREAIDQIREKKYYQKYLHPQKEIFSIGVAFDSKEKNIKEWIAEKIKDR